MMASKLTLNGKKLGGYTELGNSFASRGKNKGKKPAPDPAAPAWVTVRINPLKFKKRWPDRQGEGGGTVISPIQGLVKHGNELAVRSVPSIMLHLK